VESALASCPSVFSWQHYLERLSGGESGDVTEFFE